MIEWIPENDEDITWIDKRMQTESDPSFPLVLRTPFFSVVLRLVATWCSMYDLVLHQCYVFDPLLRRLESTGQCFTRCRFYPCLATDLV